MGQLLWGRSGGNGIIGLEEGEKCGCERDRGSEEDDGSDGDEDEDDDDGQDSDEEYDEHLANSWVRGIDACTEKEMPTHAHVRIPTDEKNSKKRFF